MLVGREPERKLVERLAAAARLGESGVLVVAGEAGIGKSALLEHATSLCDGMIVHRVVGSEMERDLAFGGLSQLLAGAVDDLDQLPDPQAHALGVALAVRTGTAVDRFAVGSATLGMLSRLAEVVPRAVFIDDAHLLDRSSAEAIVFAARRLVADPVLLLAAVRTHEPTPFLDSGLQVVELAGLDEAAALALFGNRGAPSDLAHLVRATGGNPLALLELTEHPDDIDGSWPEAPIAVPAKVGRAFLARTDQLSPPSRLALLAAAASGGDRAVVAAASRRLGVDPVRLVDAVDAGLIRFEGQTIRFRHPLVRAAVYGGAPPADRRAVHAALGAETPEHDADRRAWHLAAAVPDTDDDAADGLAAVAERARSRAAYDVAATALERSARLSTSDDQRTRRLVAAAETAWIAGQGHRSRTLLDEVGAPPADLVGRIGSLSGTIAARTGSLAEAVAVLVDTAARVAEDDPDAAVEMLADSINAGFYRADTTFLAEALTRLEELLPRATILRSRVLGTLALGMARTLLGRGGADEIRWAVGELVFATEIRNDPMRTAWLVMGVLFLREEGAFRSVLEEAVADTRAGTVLGTLPYLLFHVARDDATTDRWQEAESGYHEGIRLARESGQTTDLAASLAGLAWLEGRQDKAESCRRHAAESIELCHRHDIVLGRIWAASALSELELARGDAAAALVQLEQVIALLTEFGVHDVDLYPGAELVETLLRLGRSDGGARRGRRLPGPQRGEGATLGQGPRRTRGRTDRLGPRAGGSVRTGAVPSPAHPRPLRAGPDRAGVRSTPASEPAAPRGQAGAALGARHVRAPGRAAVGGAGCRRARGHRRDRPPPGRRCPGGPDSAGGPDRAPARGRPDDPAGGGGPLPQPQDRRVPPAPRVPEARDRFSQ